MRPNASGVITVAGPIVAIIHGGFTINGGHGIGYLHVYTTASTVMSGPVPAVGENAQVTGSGSYATSITATSVRIGSSTIALPSTILVAGPIKDLIPGGFTLNAGLNVGYIHVYTNGSTTFAGGTPKAGLYAQATGTGSLSTSITAKYVALWTSAPGIVTISGTAKAATAYGFTLDESSTYPAIPIVMNAATIVGGAALTTGAQVKVTGAGAARESIAATQIVVSPPTPAPGSSPTPTPGPISTKHLLTEDYLGSPDGTTSISWSSATPYLTWAQTGVADASAISASGIKTQFYIDPNRTTAGVGDPLYTSIAGTFAHDCSGNRVTDTYAGHVTQYVMSIGGQPMQSLFLSYVKSILAKGHFDSLYEDGAGPLSEDIWTPFSAMPCGYTDSTWVTYGKALDQVSPIPVVFNGLDALNGQGVSLSIGLLGSSNTIGGDYEDCYSDNAQPEIGGWVWQTIENTELQVVSNNKLFLCQARNNGAASSNTAARIYTLASFLLTYTPSTGVLWEEFSTPSGFHVEPESELVALDPLVPQPSTISSLKLNGGTYGRQYAHCFVAGKFVNACAVIVNQDSVAHPLPYPQYTHTLVLSGGGVLNGGTISTNGPAPPSSLSAHQALIVFP